MVVNTKHARTNFNGRWISSHTDAGRELFKNPNSVYLSTTIRERERERGRQSHSVCVVIWSLLLRSFGETAWRHWRATNARRVNGVSFFIKGAGHFLFSFWNMAPLKCHLPTRSKTLKLTVRKNLSITFGGKNLLIKVQILQIENNNVQDFPTFCNFGTWKEDVISA